MIDSPDRQNVATERVTRGSRRKRDLELATPEPWNEELPRALRWARRELPDEYPPFAAQAKLILERHRGKTSAEDVLEHLCAGRRDTASINARRAARGEEPLLDHRQVPIERWYPVHVQRALRARERAKESASPEPDQRDTA